MYRANFNKFFKKLAFISILPFLSFSNYPIFVFKRRIEYRDSDQDQIWQNPSTRVRSDEGPWNVIVQRHHLISSLPPKTSKSFPPSLDLAPIIFRTIAGPISGQPLPEGFPFFRSPIVVFVNKSIVSLQVFPQWRSLLRLFSFSFPLYYPFG